ncbi:uncharacterized protein WCC33_017841 [Rhinophrynus dorsalis]
MEEVNATTVKEFVLLAFSSFHHLQIILFIIILLMYIVSVTGNFAIIFLVQFETLLHSPMYFFISVLAALEMSFVTVTVPKLLANLIVANRTISFIGCFVQLYAFNALGVTECYLLSVMAFDRDLAINNPLRYKTIMNQEFCIELVALPSMFSFFIALIPTIFTAKLEFCGPNEVNHFFCDLAPIQNLACSNPFISNIVTSIAAVFASLTPFIIIMVCYIHIIITISKIKSAEGKRKAFSTCSSHLIVASLFYGSVIIVYIRPKGSQYDKFLALIYTVIIPTLNPFIYSLRNHDVKVTLSKSKMLRLLQGSFTDCLLFIIMKELNKTMVKEFVLLAFANLQEFQILLFSVILVVYIICVMGNIAIIVLTRLEPSLHTPMYFFVSTFSALEMLFVSAIIPKLLANLISADRGISFIGCFIQLFVSDALGSTECCLLAVMAFDRDLAINNPLHYSSIMSHKSCKAFAMFPWIFGFGIVIVPTILTAQLEFCGSNKINHFFCDFAPLQSLACSNLFICKLVTSSAATIVSVVPFIIIIGFYIHIIITISQIKIAESMKKAFSTCSSHLCVASLFYVTAIIVYGRPQGSQYDKYLALMYTVVTPLLNPFIYSLRNKDVKEAFRKAKRLKKY